MAYFLTIGLKRSRDRSQTLECTSQFVLMPLIAFVLTKVFNLPLELVVGVILVGTCPGGTSSNVMTYLAKGDVALSIAMTSVSTLLAPILTPLLTLLYAGQRVDVNVAGMFLSIIKIVIVPIALGLIISKQWGKFASQLTKVLPLVSVTAIVMIVASVVAANSARILSSGLLIVTVVMLHNMLGYATGYMVGKALRMPTPKCNAIAIEVGMQNSGLATSLAAPPTIYNYK